MPNDPLVPSEVPPVPSAIVGGEQIGSLPTTTTSTELSKPTEPAPTNIQLNQFNMDALVNVFPSTGTGPSVPWPVPQLLKQYAEIDPSLPDRLIRMVEQEAEHRRAMDQARVEGTLQETRRGQYLAAGVAAFTVAGAVLAGILGNAWSAGAIVAVYGVSHVIAALTQTHLASKEAEQKKGKPPPKPRQPKAPTPKPKLQK